MSNDRWLVLIFLSSFIVTANYDTNAIGSVGVGEICTAHSPTHANIVIIIVSSDWCESHSC